MKKFQIDSFYRDPKVGVLKFRGYLEGNLIFDNYINYLGKVSTERVTLIPEINRRRIKSLKPIPPPE